ncbi:MAG: hypothetical protein AAFR47_16330 [Pseudomonadota bacterium]
MIRKTLTAFALAAAAAAAPTLAIAASHEGPGAGISMELNSLRDVDTGCRLAFVVKNETGTALDSASYDFAIFDADGAVDRTLVFRFGELPEGKTKVMQYDLNEMACTEISRVLVNAVTECAAADGSSPDCLGTLSTSTRAEVDFGL